MIIFQRIFWLIFLQMSQIIISSNTSVVLDCWIYIPKPECNTFKLNICWSQLHENPFYISLGWIFHFVMRAFWQSLICHFQKEIRKNKEYQHNTRRYKNTYIGGPKNSVKRKCRERTLLGLPESPHVYLFWVFS